MRSLVSASTAPAPRVLVALLSVSLVGCSLNPELRLAEVAPSTGVTQLEDIPFHPQEEHHCGPASLLSLLESAGAEPGYRELVDRVYIPGLEGSLQVEMQAAARSFGYVTYLLPPEPAAVLAEVEAGRPVLVLLNLGVPSKPTWHYALVIGFDPQRNELILHSGRQAASRQRAPSWLRRWDWAGRWAMVLLEPGEWPAVADRDRLLRALAAFEEGAPPTAAADAWRTASKHWPDEPIVWLGIGNAMYRLEDTVGAREAFQRALELNPQHLPARMNLATLLADSGRACAGLDALGEPPSEGSSIGTAFRRLHARLTSECAHLRSRG